MNSLARSWYELVFRNMFLESKADEFQNLFSTVMELCHPGDFVRIRPWGRLGDRKNDGYLRSKRTLYQVYGPNEARLDNTIAKINDDFQGALPYWIEHFDKWVFVHNAVNGLAPDVLAHLLSLETNHPHVKIEHLGFVELRLKVFSLSEPDITCLLGPAPTEASVSGLRFDDITPVLEAIATDSALPEEELRLVPPNKLLYNKLSPSVEALLIGGMKKSHLVGRFFDTWSEPTFGAEIASAFQRQYALLKRTRATPDEIYMSLMRFTGGARRGTADHEAAVLAVLAHFFETCDIFERPPEGVAM